MAGIGIHFFVQNYAAPTFQVTPLLSRRSHWMEPRAVPECGGRGSQPSADHAGHLPRGVGHHARTQVKPNPEPSARFPKMTKWRATAAPLRAAADLGIELRPASGQPDLTNEEYMEALEKLLQRLAQGAAKAVPAGPENGSEFQALARESRPDILRAHPLCE